MRLGEKAARPVRAGRAVAFGRIEIGAGESSVAGWAESNPRVLGFDDVVMAVCAGIEIDFFRGAAPVACHGVCERVVFDDLDFIDEDLYLLMKVQVPVKMRIVHARSNRDTGVERAFSISASYRDVVGDEAVILE